jgi:hypothetical protein
VTYETAKAEAQAKADKTGFDYGVEADALGYRNFMLPRKENRYGFARRCEVVHCSVFSKIQPGHGP